MSTTDTTLSRRSFVKATGALGIAAAAGTFAGEATKVAAPQACAAESDAGETIVWSHCAVDCGGACPLKFHIKDGKILYVEPDESNTGEFGDTQARACLRGRSIKRWLGSDKRLNYPMRRVAGTKRGDGQYERISWDEALDLIASEFTRITETYGNEAVFIQECSGVEQNFMMNNPLFRLFNLKGGVVTRYGNYSNASINFGAWPYVYGGSWGKRSFKAIEENELVVLFGYAPNDNRMAGDGAGYDLMVAHEQKNARIISIDPRRNESCTNMGAEWIPILPGTDAALVAGLAHELIESNLVDTEFLNTYVVGFDEDSLPDDAKGQHASYYDYIMGTGYDMVEKTPAWASEITHVPEERIVKLAHEIGEAKPCFICQGWGVQRHANGDNAARAIMTLALLVGQAGIPGTCSGGDVANGGFSIDGIPTGTNPIKTKFPNFLWPEAIRDGEKLTATHDGIKNADTLKCGIKMLVNYGNNMMANQNGDINTTTEILRDDSLCEFVIQYDVQWNDSCNWADLVLPDLAVQETTTFSCAGEMNDAAGLRMGQPLYEPQYERRDLYDVCCDLAKRLDVYDEFTDGGKTREDWRRETYEDLVAQSGSDYDFPSYDECVKKGAITFPVKANTKTMPFITDPVANPLETATGKAQIYSPEIAELAKTWTIAPEQKNEITPIPVYVPGPEGAEDTTDEFPLQLQDFHYKGTVHSTYAAVDVLREVAPFQAWINPVDAERFGISDLDKVRLTSPHGSMITQARVTNRVIPGVIAHPQGAWHQASAEGDRTDTGSCTNTLTGRYCNPISKGTGQHSAIVRIEKVEA